jgi:HB1, ASXL, restriction endonuclease HTH domain
MSSTRKPKSTKSSKPKASAKPKSRKAKAPAKPAPQTLSIDDAQAPAPATNSDAPDASNTSKPLSGLDAAAIVLREASTPLNAQDLVGLMLERGLWTTEGKTPAATIYAAMIREIKAKGSASRFLKADRGRFAAAV